MLRWPPGPLSGQEDGPPDSLRLVATPIALEAYVQNFATIVKESTGCWHLCQKAEDRCRAEHFPRIVRRLEELTGTPPSWSDVFMAAADDDKYWDKEVRRPALRFLATKQLPSPPAAFGPSFSKSNEVSGMDGGSSGKQSGRKGKNKRKGGGYKRKRSTSPSSEPAAKKDKKFGNGAHGGKDHPKKDPKGRFVTTREGVQICYSFAGGERGGCADPCPNKRAHVCQTCLQPHRNAVCTKKI
jgi:hypothetical protein